MKRPLNFTVISDQQCGHELGLTPPSWDSDEPRDPPQRHPKWRMRRAIWDWLEERVRSMPVPDVLLINGDLIEGKGERSGSTEMLTADRHEQAEMADAGVRQLFYRGNRRPKVFISYGTASHTGKSEDFERNAAVSLGAEDITGEGNINLRGLIVNYKHHVGSSSIPHGRFTAIARDKLWNTLWALRGEYPRADVLIRSHVHYHGFAGTVNSLAMTTPALQGYGSKFGSRVPSGIVDVGFITFQITDRNNWSWQPHIWRAEFKLAAVVVED